MQNPNAQLRLLGDGIEYRGLPIQNIDLEAQVQNGTATIGTGRINLNAANYLDFTGEARLNDPYPYKASGAIELNDLGVFNDMLKGFGESSAASGNVHVNWSCSGDAKKVIPDGDLRVLGSQIKYRGLTVQSIDIDENLLQRKLELPELQSRFQQRQFH